MALIKSEQALLAELSGYIEQSRRTIYTNARSETVLLFWKIGKRINQEVLQNQRADYGKQIVSQVATQLM